MVINYTNIYKTNKYLSSYLIENTHTHTHTQETTTYDVGNPGPCLRQAQKCDRVKPVNGVPTLSSW